MRAASPAPFAGIPVTCALAAALASSISERGSSSNAWSFGPLLRQLRLGGSLVGQPVDLAPQHLGGDHVDRPHVGGHDEHPGGGVDAQLVGLDRVGDPGPSGARPRGASAARPWWR